MDTIQAESVDAMGRPMVKVRPNVQVYNGEFRAPHGALPAQRLAMAEDHIRAVGVSREHGYIPMVNYRDAEQVNSFKAGL